MRSFIFLMVLWVVPMALWAQQADDFDDEIEKELSTEDKEDKSVKEKNSGGSIIDRANLPDILVAADLTASKDLNDGEANTQDVESKGADMREVEFGFSGGIDHWARGTALFAAHQEGGEVYVEAHEIFFEFNKLPYNFYLKLGKFFLDTGAINSIHRHDWPFTQAPLVHAELFDGEAVADFGAELSYLMPWPFFQELKVGVFNGKKFGHAHTVGQTKQAPLYTARLRNFFSLSDNWGLKFGFSYLRYQRDTTRVNVDHTGGFDLMVRYKKGKYGVTWGNELWYRNSVNDSSVSPDPNHDFAGGYSYIEVQPFLMWRFGFRYDYLLEIKKFTASLGKTANQHKIAQSIFVTLVPSEFSYFRVTLERQDFFLVQDNYLLLAQATFILGYHPAHRY